MDLLGIISWVIFGVVVGAIAKMIMPGNQNMGWLMTIILGIVGSMVGGFVAGLLGIGQDGNMWDIGSIAISVLGALLVLFIYGKLTSRG